MSTIEELLHALETIGDPIYEQNKKLDGDELVTQERYKIDMSSILNETNMFQISNICKTFNFSCNVVSVGKGIYRHLQVQFFKKKGK